MPPPDDPAQNSSLNKLTNYRQEQGLTQAALATRIGVSRQFLNQMESGRVLPNVLIALRLAAALDQTVETLFGDMVTPPAEPTVNVIRADTGLRPGSRVRLGRVDRAWIAHAADTAASLAAGFANADGVLVTATQARLFSPKESLLGNLLIAGCDPALALLASGDATSGRTHWIDCGSGTALDALLAGRVHVAGLHYAGEKGAGNWQEVRRRAPKESISLIRFSRWEQGWMLRPEAAEMFHGTQSLANGRWVLANRDVSAASRRWLEDELARQGIHVTQVPGYHTPYASAGEAARAVAERRADIAVGPHAIAAANGLAFFPAEAVDFDLAAPTAWWQGPSGRALRARLGELAGAGGLATLPGYSQTPSGEDRPEPPRRKGKRA